jgi:hypothetical protein
MTVTWLDRARSKIRNRDLIRQFERDLQATFSGNAQSQITVCEVFEGYRIAEDAKIVLGVQVADGTDFGSHIVKIGQSPKVQRDYDGWARCFREHRIASRMLMAVVGCPLPNDRYAAIYQDAYQLFGAETDTESPKPLDGAVERGVMDNNPDSLSLERAIVEVFSELYRCLYRDAREDSQRACAFYRAELEKENNGSAWERWQGAPEYADLRRDALWLTTASAKPASEQPLGYADPFDFLSWAFHGHRLPATLVGRSHGDLHGRNIVVGVYRGEVFQPAIFDYGDMTDTNVIVWDFVKLESELKCRVLPNLFDAPGARDALASVVPPLRKPIGGTTQLLVDEQESARRADRLEFAFQFETALAAQTREIVGGSATALSRRGKRHAITGHGATDRALFLLLRIRQEAAHWLGFNMARAAVWRDEFYFALAVYGLLSAKWPVDPTHLEWALMSAGVAVAQLDYAVDQNLTVQGFIRQSCCPLPPAAYPDGPLPSCRIPLAWAHNKWQDKQHDNACEILEKALARFPQAVSLRQEQALCLASKRDLVGAKRVIEPLRRLCHVFRDFETLCRLGRILKDSGDAAWQIDRPTHRRFVADKHSGYQLYKDAQRLYTEAFEFSQNYYPGINAATLALLTGDPTAKSLAEQVLRICASLSVQDFEEQYWINATEGEAWLVARQKVKAASFYASALNNPCARTKGLLQPLYDQLCRLHWAMGLGFVRPILETMERLDLLRDLDRGPFENCGRP